MLMSLSGLGCVLVRLRCLSQTDIKKLIAYSSVVHMALMIVRIFSLTISG